MATSFEKQLALAVQKGALTQDGNTWLKAALNPFPTKPIETTGVPDSARGRSIVRVIPGYVTISAPPALTGDFDVHIFSFPEVCRCAFAISNTTGHAYDTALNSWKTLEAPQEIVHLGLFNVVLVPAGSPTLPTTTALCSSAFLLPTGSWIWTSNYAEYCKGPTRLVSAGFKVDNTTPVINLGGASVSYRKSAPVTDVTMWSTGLSSINTSIQGRQFVAPPGTADEASRLPSAVFGKAKDGILVPLMINSQQPPRACRYNNMTVLCEDEPNALVPTWTRTTYAGTPAAIGSAKTEPFSCVKESGTDIAGVYFTGCPNETTFTLSTTVTLETFPNVTDPDITLSHVAPTYDEVALELYRRIASNVESTLPASGAGAWWSLICKAGLAATSLIPNPLFRNVVALTWTTGMNTVNPMGRSLTKTEAAPKAINLIQGNVTARPKSRPGREDLRRKRNRK